VIVLDYVVGYMPRHHVEGSTFFRILRDERGDVHISYGNLFKDTL
jgi:hypothetical protein